MTEENRFQRPTLTTRANLALVSDIPKKATSGLLIVVFSGILSIGNLRVAYMRNTQEHLASPERRPNDSF